MKYPLTRLGDGGMLGVAINRIPPPPRKRGRTGSGPGSFPARVGLPGSTFIMKLLLIEWVDASSSCKWESLEVLGEREPEKIRTVGWLAGETKEGITLVSSISDFGRADGDMTIPKCSITSRKVLRKG